MPDVKRILENLSHARERLFLAADAVTPGQWRTPPQPDAWSAAEVIAHLTMVEGTVTGTAGRLLGQPPHTVPFWKRLHVPVRLTEWRAVRRRTPLPLDASLIAEKETMLAALRAVRMRTLALLDETRSRDLSAYRWPHPFLGSLNLYDWFRMVAHHEVRHAKQIREIVEVLQK